MHNILVLTEQPPGTNGVQAIRYSKLYSPLLALGYRLYFVGPDPSCSSVFVVTTNIPSESRVYVACTPYSRRFSVYRHRLGPLHPGRVVLWLLQAISFAFEMAVRGFRRHNPHLLLIKQKSLSLIADIKFSAIAGICPSYEILNLSYQISLQTNLPLISIYDDPYGSRSSDKSFLPHLPSEQKTLLAHSKLAIFASPLTRSNYIDCGLVEPSKSAWVTDCHSGADQLICPDLTSPGVIKGPRLLDMVHLGNLGAWRPVRPLFESLTSVNIAQEKFFARFINYGLIDDSASRLLIESPELNDTVFLLPGVDYEQSHVLASQSSVIVVIVGPRHHDNLPSKFFEYLNHKKPILLLCPPEHYLADLIDDSGIGASANIESASSIQSAILSIYSNHSRFCAAYDRSSLIPRYSPQSVSTRWAQMFDRVLS